MRLSGETVRDQTFSHLFETAAHSHGAFRGADYPRSKLVYDAAGVEAAGADVDAAGVNAATTVALSATTAASAESTSD